MRNISEISKKEWFQRLTLHERCAWIMMVSELADDQGRFEENYRNYRSFVFCGDPIPDEEIKTIVTSLEKHGLLLRYTVGEQVYGQITNWWKEQSKSQWMGKSQFPAPAGWIDATRANVKGSKTPVTSDNWKRRETDAGFITRNSGLPTINSSPITV